ncbi:histone lysine methyltransferase Set9 [Coemansia erecta]|uniref:Histone lysine methyltransferase Set9 n=1 Tax=Coemansia erecta TaxID=147472 RepID=A0A9W8CSY5_9FUNG|nr:histone lysine methyltransferase Set9 [Coemansia erecta]
MPPASADPPLDAQTLSHFDDVLSDVLLDQLGLWFTTRKMHPRPRRTPGDRAQTLALVQQLAHGHLDVPQAVDQLLLRQRGVAQQLHNKPAVRLADFRQHAARYLRMYLPDAGFEISQTRRYAGVAGKEAEEGEAEAADAMVVATRRYAAGAVIGRCEGGVAQLSDAEVAGMEQRRADWSVMWWGKRRAMCLLLGPARFVNHDCASNARFTALAQGDAICFQALRTILPGDEITTHYGNDYFGPGNCECLCATCERHGRGAYAVKDGGSSPGEEGKGAVATPPGSAEDSAAEGAGAGDAGRPRTRNAGLRSVTPAACLPRGQPPARFVPDGRARCPVCGDLQAGAAAASLEAGALTPPADTDQAAEEPPVCARCTRHQLLFSLPWPDRPQPAHMPSRGSLRKRQPAQQQQRQRKQQQPAKRRRPSRPRPCIYDGAQGPALASLAEMFAARAPGTPVLVDPLADDGAAAPWWPAVIVEPASVAADTPATAACHVRYFEDGSFSQCAGPADLVPLDLATPMFARWPSLQAALADMPVRRAIAYTEWRYWAAARVTGAAHFSPEADAHGVNEIARVRHVFPASAPAEKAPGAQPMGAIDLPFEDFFARAPGDCVRAYLHVPGDTIHVVDARDGEVYRAKVLEVDFLETDARSGLYYYVHYHKWSPKFDEWVPPSRITYDESLA